MRPDAPVSERRKAASPSRGAMVLGGPVLIVPRRLQGGVAAALDALRPDELPRLRFEGALADLRTRLRRAVAERLDRPRWLADWLVSDVVEQAGLMAGLTDAPALRVRLDVVDDDRCPKFHVDDVRLRLLTTYRGPGTEWIPPLLAGRATASGVVLPDAVRRLERGEVAVLRGGKGATRDRPGVLHRSPPIAGTGVVRLFLAIDEAGRQLH